MTTIRQPAVAGMFYPSDPEELRQMLTGFLVQTRIKEPVPKAIVAPHAGYVYSGPVAASAYACLAPAREWITNVVLLGPSHHVPFHGLAATRADVFNTPLGAIAVNRDLVGKIAALEQVVYNDLAHLHEHSLEVHLPFLQMVLARFALVPLVVGDATAAQVSEVLEAVWGGPETLIVVSSDLSHYHGYQEAMTLDRATSAAIERLDAGAIGYEQACGRNPLLGLLAAAQAHGLRAKTIDLRNSGDTAGPRDRVVGYGAYVFH